MRTEAQITDPGAPAPSRAAVVALCAALLCSLAALLAPNDAHACSCAGYGSERELERGFARADVAFTGSLVAVRPGPNRYTRRFVFRVSTAYKGAEPSPGRRIVIEAASSGASCGLPRGGRERGLFADRRRDGRLSSSLCAVVTPRQMERASDRDGSRPAGASPASANCGAG